MPPLSHSDPSTPSRMRRIDRAVGDLNAVLLVFAIGLAVLDLTCFIGMMSITEIRNAEQAALLAAPAPPRPLDSAFR